MKSLYRHASSTDTEMLSVCYKAYVSYQADVAVEQLQS